MDKKIMPQKEIITVDELANLTGYSKTTIYILRSQGKIPESCYFYLAGGRLLRFHLSEVMKWITGSN
jgi:excisionase family DNA binding protein